MRRLSCALASFCFFCADTIADERPDKSGFNLFRPTPEALLRDMATDRPDKTESAFTVDAGHYQVEMDLLNYTYDRSKHESAKFLAIAPLNLKVGMLNNVDFQIVVETYNVQQIKDRESGRSSRVSGLGDVLLRCKTNLWGNDGGATALSMMPFLKLPTSSEALGNGATEGGIILPFAMELPGEWDLGAQLEVDYLRNASDSDYHEDFINTITVSRDITGKLGGYVELFSNLSNESEADWIATFDFGFTYALSRDVQLDAGLNVGLSDAADDFNPFIGVSVRY